MIRDIKNLIKFRELILALLIRGFKEKYKNSFLGVFWSLLNPLLNVLIFTIIFTFFIKIQIRNYPLYLLCTILPWNFFNSSLINSIVSLVEDDRIVKNIAFPIEAIPLSATIVNLINFIIDLIILFPILFLFGKGLSLNWLYIPWLIFIEFIIVSGLSILLSGLYVIFRDLNFIMNVALRLFFYFLPVIYTLEFVPKKLLCVYLLNPLAVVIDGFAKVLFYGASPDIKWLLLASLESVVIFLICFGIFQRMRRAIPEWL